MSAQPLSPALALLVIHDEAGRRDAARALERAGYETESTREPYEAMARFMERPAGVIVLSLARIRSRDLTFLEAIRRRAPTARVIVLVPEGRRALAVRALEGGADAYLPEPCYPSELTALARRYLALHTAAQAPSEGAAPGRLGHVAREISHAINNPLQVLSLLSETGALGEDPTPVKREVTRIERVIHWLNAFADLTPPHPQPVLIGPLVAETLARASSVGRVRAGDGVVAPGPELQADPGQVRLALETLLEYLYGLGEGDRVAVDGRVRPVRMRQGQAVEAALRARGLSLEAGRMEADRGRILWSHEDTRQAHPGLALPQAVARAHHGQLVARMSSRGPVLALRLPLAPPL